MPVTVSPLIRGARWSALLVGISYGAIHNRTVRNMRIEDIAHFEKKTKEEAEAKAAKLAAEANDLVTLPNDPAMVKLQVEEKNKKNPYNRLLITASIDCTQQSMEAVVMCGERLFYEVFHFLSS